MYFTGPYKLNQEMINVRVERTIGAYLLGKSNLDQNKMTVYYVGRSDTNVNERLQQHIGSYSDFMIMHCNSPINAFNMECDRYHQFKNQIINENHPDKPNRMEYLKCPICEC